jgi:L-alanine-DL-glutamate epimerase-like enolase superfamily enzyme
MLRRLRILKDTRKLAVPFRISRGVRHASDLLVVELEEEGTIGRGEGAPISRYDESVESCMMQIEALRPQIEQGMCRTALQEVMRHGAARNALDCALWDLEAQRAGTNAAALAGLPLPRPIVTARTISINETKEMGRAARALSQAALIKVKVDANDPAAQLRAVRASAPGPRLIVDANEAWSPDLLAAMLPVLAELRVDALEQPLAAGKDDVLRHIYGTTPIFADESCHVAADVEKLAGKYQGVNIKLDKSGGLTEAMDLLAAARRANMLVMTGCMICSSLSISPAFLVAMQADYADLDGPLWLAQDQPGGVRLANGVLTPPSSDLWGGQ